MLVFLMWVIGTFSAQSEARGTGKVRISAITEATARKSGRPSFICTAALDPDSLDLTQAEIRSQAQLEALPITLNIIEQIEANIATREMAIAQITDSNGKIVLSQAREFWEKSYEHLAQSVMAMTAEYPWFSRAVSIALNHYIKNARAEFNRFSLRADGRTEISRAEDPDLYDSWAIQGWVRMSGFMAEVRAFLYYSLQSSPWESNYYIKDITFSGSASTMERLSRVRATYLHYESLGLDADLLFKTDFPTLFNGSKQKNWEAALNRVKNFELDVILKPYSVKQKWVEVKMIRHPIGWGFIEHSQTDRAIHLRESIHQLLEARKLLGLENDVAIEFFLPGGIDSSGIRYFKKFGISVVNGLTAMPHRNQ